MGNKPMNSVFSYIAHVSKLMAANKWTFVMFVEPIFGFLFQ